MAIIKKKTRKAIRKNVSKVISKHGPTIATHVATGIATGLAGYLGAEPKKGQKQLKKVAKLLPTKKIGRALAAIPAIAEKVPGLNGDKQEKGARSAKKRAKS